MDRIIVDTSALIAFFVGSEKHHPTARQFISKNKTLQWVILESVFDECVTWFRAKVSIAASIEIGSILREEHIFVNIADTDDKATWDAFQMGAFHFSWRFPEKKGGVGDVHPPPLPFFRAVQLI